MNTWFKTEVLTKNRGAAYLQNSTHKEIDKNTYHALGIVLASSTPVRYICHE
jgi:hypothetical protein